MNMYSQHGFDALIRCVALHGFHVLMSVSYCMPGSPHTHADSAIFTRSAFASNVPMGSPVVTAFVVCVPPVSTALHERVRDAHGVVRVLEGDVA